VPKRTVDSVLVFANGFVLIVAIFFLSRPNGPIGSYVSRWRKSREESKLVARSWNALRDGGYVLASTDDSTAWVVEFSDYQCPYCRGLAPVLESLLRQSKLGVVIRHYPLPYHPMAAAAARSAICANAQGRFSQMHHQLFTSVQWQTDSDWVREAKAADVADIPRFRKCLSAESTQAALDRDIEMGTKLHVNGTPTLFLQSGRLPNDSLTVDSLRAVGRAALDRQHR
jgi:protein-disulfide isomerase